MSVGSVIIVPHAGLTLPVHWYHWLAIELAKTGDIVFNFLMIRWHVIGARAYVLASPDVWHPRIEMKQLQECKCSPNRTILVGHMYGCSAIAHYLSTNDFEDL